ncbi:MFS transporter [Gallaecimonas kandeliae]|uniref:MFS transporter n=1 Tax=Gallaecimonas kandeliae TaxID=3029055 RepID=UPI0026488F25|nr:MFS transporter [Gallaecimonas kandeliae]WKE65406.1 MFS transporter [Gallaecimonas kandeliae]
MSQTLFVPGQGAIAATFGISPGMTQGIMAAYLAMYGLSQFVYGPLSDNLGRRPVTLGGLVLFLAGSLLAWHAASFTMLIAGALVQGLGAGVAGVMVRTVPRDRFEGPALTRVNGLLSMALILSPMLAPVLGGFLVSHFDWRACYLFLLGLGGAVLLLQACCFAETLPADPEPRAPAWVRYQATWQNANFRHHLWPLLAVFSGVVVFEAAAGVLLGERLGLPASLVSWLYIAPLPPYIAGSFLAASLAHRWRHRALLQLGTSLLLLAALAQLLLAWALPMNAWTLLGPVSLYFLAAGLLGPVATSGALSDFRKGAGTAGALLGGLQNLAAGLAAGLSSFIPQHDALPLGALLTLFAVLAWWQARRVGELHAQVANITTPAVESSQQSL